MAGNWGIRTEIEPPSEVRHADLGKLSDDKGPHPIRSSRSSRTSRSPTQRVNLGVIDPRNLPNVSIELFVWQYASGKAAYLGVAGAVEKVIEEEHRCCDSTHLCS